MQARRGQRSPGHWALTVVVVVAGALTACGGGSSGSSSGRGASDQDLQAARLAAIAGCAAVSTASTAPAGGATSDQLQAIQDAFNNTPDVGYPGTGPLLRRLLTASSPTAKTQAVSDLQRWCVSQHLAPQR